MHIGKKPFENFRDMKISVDLITEVISQQYPAPKPKPTIRRRNTTMAPRASPRKAYEPLPNVRSPLDVQERYQKMIEKAFTDTHQGNLCGNKSKATPSLFIGALNDLEFEEIHIFIFFVFLNEYNFLECSLFVMIFIS